MLPRHVDRLGALIGGGLIALATVAPRLEAQTPAPRPSVAPAARGDDSITLTGCLLLGPYGDYTLSKTIVSSGSIMHSVAWKLKGGTELLAHILEEVEVTGTMLRTPPETAGTAGSAGNERPADRSQSASYRLHVTAIRKIVGDCS